MHYAAIPVSCNKSAAVSRTAQESHEDESRLLYKQMGAKQDLFVSKEISEILKKIENVVRGTESKAAGIRDVAGDKKAGVSCKVLFDTIVQV